MTVHARERSSAELAGEIVHDARRLLRLEIDLALQEARELAVRNGVAVGLLATGGLLFGLAVLVGVPVLLVAWAPNHVVAAAIWIGAYLLLAVALLATGRSLLRFEAPRRTMASLKETREWAHRQISSSGR